MTTRTQTADRFCLTCGRTSARKDFKGPKCGKCVKEFGLPRKSEFNRTALQPKTTPVVNTFKV